MREEAKKAGWYYDSPDYQYNCAQAIAHCWSGDEAFILEMKYYGGGKSPDGVCGAIHAAKLVSIKLNLDSEKLEKSFIARAGALKCKEIRACRLISCRGCVDLAHDILSDLSVGEK